MLWRQTESKLELEGTYQKKDTRENYKKKFKKGDTDEVFKYRLGKIHNRFIKKYDARKQKAYMRAGLLKPKSYPINIHMRTQEKQKSLIQTC